MIDNEGKLKKTANELHFDTFYVTRFEQLIYLNSFFNTNGVIKTVKSWQFCSESVIKNVNLILVLTIDRTIHYVMTMSTLTRFLWYIIVKGEQYRWLLIKPFRVNRQYYLQRLHTKSHGG